MRYMIDFQTYTKYFKMSRSTAYMPCNLCPIKAVLQRKPRKMLVLGHENYNHGKRDKETEVNSSEALSVFNMRE